MWSGDERYRAGRTNTLAGAHEIKSLNTSFVRVRSWSTGTPHGVRDIGAFLKYITRTSRLLPATWHSIRDIVSFSFFSFLLSSSHQKCAFAIYSRFYASKTRTQNDHNQIGNYREKKNKCRRRRRQMKSNLAFGCTVTRNCRRCMLLCRTNHIGQHWKSTQRIIINSMRWCCVSVQWINLMNNLADGAFRWRDHTHTRAHTHFAPEHLCPSKCT